MAKSPLKRFEIEIQGLPNTLHSFEFAFDDQLFGAFESSLVEKGHGKVSLGLNKSETMMTLSFKITGEVELVCDRSLRTFEHEFDIEEDLIVKFGEEEAELDDNIIVIKRESQYFNIAQYVYEYISVAIPMKKIHPELRTEQDDDDGYGALIYQTSKEEQADEDEKTDPRWEALKKLRNN